MPNYMLAYHGGTKPETPEIGAAMMQRWKDWLAGLGDAVVNPGTPLSAFNRVDAKGVSQDALPGKMIGFSVITAPDQTAALSIAQSCPHLEMAGSHLEVAEMKQM